MRGFIMFILQWENKGQWKLNEYHSQGVAELTRSRSAGDESPCLCHHADAPKAPWRTLQAPNPEVTLLPWDFHTLLIATSKAGFISSFLRIEVWLQIHPRPLPVYLWCQDHHQCPCQFQFLVQFLLSKCPFSLLCWTLLPASLDWTSF